MSSMATITIAATGIVVLFLSIRPQFLSIGGGFQISYMVLYHVIYSYAVLKTKTCNAF